MFRSIIIILQKGLRTLFNCKIIVKNVTHQQLALDFYKKWEYNISVSTRTPRLLNSLKCISTFNGGKIMTIKPLFDRVVVRLCEAEETTASGIILTAAAQEKPQVAEVIAVGPGGNVDGKEVTMTVKVGDKVITSKYAGTEVKVDGEEYNIVRQNDILAVVE